MRTRRLETPPAEWSRLLALDRNASPAHRPEVAQAMAAVLPGMSAHWLVAEDASGIVGGMPLVIERRAGAHWLHALPHLLPGTPLARDGMHAEVDAAIARALAAEACAHEAAGGEWSCYRPQGTLAPGVLESIPGHSTVFDTALIPLHPGEPFEARLDRDERHLLRRARREGFEFREAPDALARVYALHLMQSRAWPGHRPLPLELSRRLLEGGREAPGHLFVVVHGVRIVAGAFALDHEHETFLWWSGAQREARAGSASRALLAAIADWATVRGRSRMNLGGSAGIAGLRAFKRSLGARDMHVPVRWLDARHAAWPARALAAAQSWRRRRRSRGESL